jgi:hypothetical protein
VPTCWDENFVYRPYAELFTRMKNAHPGTVPIVIANGDIPPPNPHPLPPAPGGMSNEDWRASFAPTFAAASDYFLNVALTNDDVAGFFIWSYFTSNLPTVKAKYRFFGRALGFGCTEGVSCPAAW